MEDFASAAGRFCAVIEANSTLGSLIELGKLERVLAAVYAAAVGLPEVDSDERELPASRMSAGEWRALFESLRRRLGDVDRYWTVFNPSDAGSVVEASLADDLADVYRELASGLDALHSGAAPEDVLFHWRTGFEIHWGRHALAALAALRSVIGRAR